jgi:drug/metabolite transporter (DMT)-like permease
MEYLYIFILILLYTGQSFFCRLYTNKYPGDPDATTPVFSVVSGAITALAALIFAACVGFHWNWQIIAMGLVNCLILAVYNFCMVKASERGPYSIQMTMMLSGGIIIPALFSYVYGGGLKPLGWLFVAIIALSILLVSKKKGESLFSGGLQFWIFVILLFVFNGLYGAIMAHQSVYSVTADSKNELIICTFGFSALINTFLGFYQRKSKFISDFRQSKASLISLLLSSAFTASAVILLTILINSGMSTDILFTFDNAGVLLFSVLFSFIVFKEKLSWLNLVGCATMAFGLVGIVFWGGA